jgi:hypothetical protein
MRDRKAIGRERAHGFIPQDEGEVPDEEQEEYGWEKPASCWNGSNEGNPRHDPEGRGKRQIAYERFERQRRDRPMIDPFQ